MPAGVCVGVLPYPTGHLGAVDGGTKGSEEENDLIPELCKGGLYLSSVDKV